MKQYEGPALRSGRADRACVVGRPAILTRLYRSGYIPAAGCLTETDESGILLLETFLKHSPKGPATDQRFHSANLQNQITLLQLFCKALVYSRTWSKVRLKLSHEEESMHRVIGPLAAAPSLALFALLFAGCGSSPFGSVTSTAQSPRRPVLRQSRPARNRDRRIWRDD